MATCGQKPCDTIERTAGPFCLMYYVMHYRTYHLLCKSTGRVHRVKKLSGPDFPSVT
jgi:hypothetical protein